MGIFGWSLPPGCNTLPGEDEVAAEALLYAGLPEGVTAWWEEDGRIVLQREGETFAVAGELEWDNHIDDSANTAAAVIKLAEHFGPIEWVTFTRRTEDPKLAYIEHRLTLLGIPHRRNWASWHAPILEVPQAQSEAAWALLDEQVDTGVIDKKLQRLDDVPDGHWLFDEFRLPF